MSIESTSPHFKAVEDSKYLVVRSGGEQFGIRTSCVLGVLRNHSVYPVPGSAPPLVGLSQVGGEPMVVVDPKELIDGKVGAEDHGLILLVKAGPESRIQTIGLAIDEALEMVSIPALDSEMEAGKVTAGETTFDGRRVRILNPERLTEPSQRPAVRRPTQ